MGENVKLNGLGLTICQSIVKLLGGRIWLDTSYTEGSCFIFELLRRLTNKKSVIFLDIDITCYPLSDSPLEGFG